MKNYIKLAKIKYNNKRFVVFSDNNHKKTFIEVKVKDNKEVYYYPLLEDVINLNLVFNHGDKLYSKKYKFDEKVYAKRKKLRPIINFSLGVIIGISATLTYKLTKEKYPFFGYKAENKIIVTDNAQLDDLNLEEVTFEDVRQTLNENKNIGLKYKNYILEYLEALEERLPNVDLRIFNKNLKNLYFKVIPIDEWDEPTVAGAYYIADNYIKIKSEYKTEYREKFVIFHELTHVTNSGIYEKEKIDNEYYVIKKTYQDLENEYGYGTMEAMTEIITDYLISSNYTMYFTVESHNYDSYKVPANTIFQILKLVDDYTLYDYFNSDIYKFEEVISKYNIEEVLPLLDIEVSDEKAGDLEIEESNLEQYQDIILKERFKRLKQDGKLDEILAYRRIKNTNISKEENRIEIIEDLFQEHFIDIEIKEEGTHQHTTYNIVLPDSCVEKNEFDFLSVLNVDLYNGESKIYHSNPEKLFFYMENEKYRVGYIENTYLSVNGVSINNYYDIKSKKELKLKDDDIIYVSEFLEYYMGIKSQNGIYYNIKIDISKLNEETIEDHLNLERILKRH